jgi:AcrR family transcriptional regulator
LTKRLTTSVDGHLFRCKVPPEAIEVAARRVIHPSQKSAYPRERATLPRCHNVGVQPVRIPNASRRNRDGAQSVPAEKRRGTGRTVRGRQSRQQLIDAARTVFERDGFLRARIADICDEAGMSHGSFYTYFVSKEEIFQELVDSIEFDLLRVDPIAEDAKPIDRIRSANRHYLQTYRDNAAILRVIQQVATFDEEVRQTRIKHQDALAHAIERRTREYQSDGLADDQINAWFAANALGGMVAFVSDQIVSRDVPVDIDFVIEQLTRLWANAIGLKY